LISVEAGRQIPAAMYAAASSFLPDRRDLTEQTLSLKQRREREMTTPRRLSEGPTAEPQTATRGTPPCGPTCVRQFVSVEAPPELGDRPLMPSFTAALDHAFRCALESVPVPCIRAIPFEGYLFLAVDALGRLPAVEDIILVYTTEQTVDFIEVPDGRTAEFVAGFRYCMMDLSGEGEETWELTAEEHPNLHRFLNLRRQEMVALLADYARHQMLDFR
jgi:hypothetical protein